MNEIPLGAIKLMVCGPRPVNLIQLQFPVHGIWTTPNHYLLYQ